MPGPPRRPDFGASEAPQRRRDRDTPDTQISKELSDFLRREAKDRSATFEQLLAHVRPRVKGAEAADVQRVLDTQLHRDGRRRFEHARDGCQWRATASSESMADTRLSHTLVEFLRKSVEGNRATLHTMLRHAQQTLRAVDEAAVKRVLGTARHRDGRPRFELHGDLWHATASTGGMPSERVSRRLLWYLRYAAEADSDGFVPWRDALKAVQGFGSERDMHRVINEAKDNEGRVRFELKQDGPCTWVRAASRGVQRGSRERLHATTSIVGGGDEDAAAFAAEKSSVADTVEDDDILSELQKRLEELDQIVAPKGKVSCCPSPVQRQLVQEIGQLLERWMSSWRLPSLEPSILIPGEWPLRGGGKVDEQPGVMKRVTVFQGKGIMARMHFFEDPAETYIHNHGTPFFSYCMQGGYIHRLWTAVDRNEGSTFYEFNRTEDQTFRERPPAEIKGRPEVASEHQHQAGLTYFIGDQAMHTVVPEDDRPGPVLTLYVKGTERFCDTKVWSEMPEGPPGNREEERELQGEERLAVLRRLAAEI